MKRYSMNFYLYVLLVIAGTFLFAVISFIVVDVLFFRGKNVEHLTTSLLFKEGETLGDMPMNWFAGLFFLTCLEFAFIGTLYGWAINNLLNEIRNPKT